MSDSAPEIRADFGTRFKKGNATGGRKPIPEELKVKARNLCQKVLEVWEQIMIEGKKDSDRLKAGENLWGVAYGKFDQHITADVETNVNMITHIGVPDFAKDD